ncbi:TetR/AcrR family transcriptional regulator [Rhodococcus qingshengii]|uniref:TetR/AcrR family transcriptional regulator n=1 Tax=Rhodococcus qingshengii TaxID=334542 RepID=UPI00364E6D9C
MAARGVTRKKMLEGAITVLQERGAAGLTIDAVLDRSESPRGSVYHHFPGGRNQILEESLLRSGRVITDMVTTSAQGRPIEALQAIVNFWAKALQDANFETGCPLVAVAVSGTADDHALFPEIADVIDQWRGALTKSLISAGTNELRAVRISTLVISSIEGAIILCRIQHSTAPLYDTANELERAIAAAMADESAHGALDRRAQADVH